MTDRADGSVSTGDAQRSQSTYSAMHRESAIRMIAVREKIEATGDTDLMRLLEERDMLFTSAEEGREIRSEWAALARKLVDALTPNATHACACDVCAISHGLDAAVGQHEAHLALEAAWRRMSLDPNDEDDQVIAAALARLDEARSG